MNPREPQKPFEVYCDQCNVSAPVGTRRCLHCGGRMSGTRGSGRTELTKQLEAELPHTEEQGEELATSIGSAAPKIALWFALLIGGFLYRMCH